MGFPMTRKLSVLCYCAQGYVAKYQQEKEVKKFHRVGKASRRVHSPYSFHLTQYNFVLGSQQSAPGSRPLEEWGKLLSDVAAAGATLLTSYSVTFRPCFRNA
jgi:hypothetical protein